MEKVTKKKLGIIPKILIIFCLLTGLLYVWMHFIEPRLLKIKDYPLVNEKIPSSFDGFTIVEFSDIHFGRTINEKELDNVIKRINDCHADIILFAGDLFDNYINYSDKNYDYLKETMAKLHANIKKYAVYGDQDYINEEKYKEIMENAGFTFLNGKNEAIYYEGNTPIYISGSPSITKTVPNLEEAFKKEQDSLQLFLSHEPLMIENIKNQTDIFFTGHTLGGLIRIPFIGGVINKDNTAGYEKGKYQKDNTTIYVSNGIGTENYSLRLFNIPSIYCFRMTI